MLLRLSLLCRMLCPAASWLAGCQHRGAFQACVKFLLVSPIKAAAEGYLLYSLRRVPAKRAGAREGELPRSTSQQIQIMRQHGLEINH